MGATQMKPDGFFHTTGTQALKRQVWAGQFSLTNGQSSVFIRNRGQYARCYFEVFLQAAHGSNGYAYYLANVSRYGTDIAVQDVNFTGSISTTSENNSLYQGLTVNASTNTGYYIHVNVYYHNTETGLDVDSPAGLTKIGTGV